MDCHDNDMVLCLQAVIMFSFKNHGKTLIQVSRMAAYFQNETKQSSSVHTYMALPQWYTRVKEEA